jgi:hypothetical protein
MAVMTMRVAILTLVLTWSAVLTPPLSGGPGFKRLCWRALKRLAYLFVARNLLTG